MAVDTRQTRTRERRVVVAGAVVVVMALLVTRGVMPWARAWQAREAAIETAQQRANQLAGMVTQSAAYAQAAVIAERELAGAPRRVLRAHSTALAASALQALLQNATDGAGMVVNRVDVTPGDDTTATPTVGGTLSVVGDIHGLAALLATLERGARVVFVDRVSVTQNTALRGAPDVLQVTLGVRAPVILE